LSGVGAADGEDMVLAVVAASLALWCAVSAAVAVPVGRLIAVRSTYVEAPVRASR
jgi:hypothetical protein